MRSSVTGACKNAIVPKRGNIHLAGWGDGEKLV